MKIELTPVAYIESEFKDNNRKITKDTISKIILTDDFTEEAFYGLETLSHLEIIWYFHLSNKTIKTMGYPRGDTNRPKRGIFALRSPHRPNHIATTIVKLIKKEGKTITVYGLDAIDGSPVLDIKPADQALKGHKF
jgi:tRNA-Thr(GGU) m(6)t(6)A37 methyltransferase TsaA